MGVLSWFKTRFRDQAEHYTYVDIDPSNVRHADGSAADDTALVAGEHYLRLWLVEMFLKNDRDWFAKWHPAVHAATNLEFGDQTQLITKVAGPSNLQDLDSGHLDRVISLNHPLTTLMPFKGGSVELDAGLLAMKGRDDVKTFIKVLGDFSNVLAVPQLSSALAIAGPLADGVAEMVGATDGNLVLGLHQTFTSAGGGGDAILRAGYQAVVRATEQEIDRDQLWVVEDRLHQGASAEASRYLTGRHYMLLRIEARSERDDWDSITSIQKPFELAIDMLELENLEQADAYRKAAIAAALKAAELTKVDRRRVIQQIKTQYRQAREDFQPGAFADVDRSLSSLMAGAMSVAEARAEPELTAAEAFTDLD